VTAWRFDHKLFAEIDRILSDGVELSKSPSINFSGGCIAPAPARAGTHSWKPGQDYASPVETGIIY
jgi:hypothetical protein